MTDVELLAFNDADNTYRLSSEEQAEYSNNQFKEMNEIVGVIEFDCPTTLEQLWKEIEDGVKDNDSEVNLARQNSLRYMEPGRYKNLLHVFSRDHSGVSFDNQYASLHRATDLALGIICQEAGPVSFKVGGSHKFTKDCKEGINLFTKEEVIPIEFLQYHAVQLLGKHVSHIVYGQILNNKVNKELEEFYSNSENPTMYHVISGLDRRVVESRKAEMAAAGITITLN